MEPSQPSQPLVTEPQKNFFCRVTPFSKYLAMMIFIAMPFIGGYVGYHFSPVKVVEVERVQPIPEREISTVIADATPNIEDAEPSYKIFPVISEECKNITSEPDPYYAVYADDLTMGEMYRCDYERQTGKTYELSSSTIRIIDWERAQKLNTQRSAEVVEYKNVNLPKDLEVHTQLPYLIALSTTSDEMILTSHCFVAKECSFAGLFRFNLQTNTLSRMKTGKYFDVSSLASLLSPDRTKILSSDEIEGNQSNLYLVDLKTDTYKILDTLDPSSDEGSFCTVGINGCDNIIVDWLPDNTIEVQVFKKGGKREVRVYPLD